MNNITLKMEVFYEVMYRYEAKLLLNKMGCTDIKWFYSTFDKYKAELHPLVYVFIYLREKEVVTIDDIFKSMHMKSFDGANQYNANLFFDYLISKLNFTPKDIDLYNRISQIMSYANTDN